MHYTPIRTANIKKKKSCQNQVLTRDSHSLLVEMFLNFQSGIVTLEDS